MSVSHTPGTHAHPELGFLRKYIFSEDHKIIGIQFLFSGLIFFLMVTNSYGNIYTGHC